jgi:hypothetical protein
VAEVNASSETLAQRFDALAQQNTDLTTKVDGLVNVMDKVSEKVDALDQWAETTPAAKAAKPKPEAADSETPDAKAKLNNVFAKMATGK